MSVRIDTGTLLPVMSIKRAEASYITAIAWADEFEVGFERLGTLGFRFPGDPYAGTLGADDNLELQTREPGSSGIQGAWVTWFMLGRSHFPKTEAAPVQDTTRWPPPFLFDMAWNSILAFSESLRNQTYWENAVGPFFLFSQDLRVAVAFICRVLAVYQRYKAARVLQRVLLMEEYVMG